MSEDVTFSESDNNLGVVATSEGQKIAIIGNCTGSLAVATPIQLARIADVISECGSGPLVEAASLIIDHTGLDVILCNPGVTTAGSYGSVTKVGTGTSVITANVSTPKDAFDVKVIWITGGTIGVTGITYKYSLDGGLNYTPELSLGTATAISLPADVGFDLAAGTIVAGDTFTCRTVAPKWNDSQMTAAIAALANFGIHWDMALILGPITATNVANIETSGTTLFNAGDPKMFLTDFRRRNVSGETEAQYATAYNTEFASTACKYTSIGADVVKCLSSTSVYASQKWRIKRQISIAVAVKALLGKPGQDAAWVRKGALPPAFQIVAADQNPDDHDERANPGLDAYRATTLMTRRRRAGVYVKNWRIKSAAGSDFEFAQHRLVMNIAERIAIDKLELAASQAVLVNKKTGKIKEEEALAIENEVNAALYEALVKTSNVTDVRWKCSRTDNILSTKTLNGDLQLIPLAYIKAIRGKASFFNPALQVVEV